MKIVKIKIKCSCGYIFYSKYLPIIKCRICSNKLYCGEYFLKEEKDNRYKALTDLGYTNSQISEAIGDIVFENMNSMIKHVIKYYE